MAAFRRLRVKDLIALMRRMPPVMRGKYAEIFVSMGIIRSFLEIDYINKHFGPDAPADGFFKFTEEKATNQEAARNYRIVDLAELLFNLQGIPGFTQCVLRMKEATNPEPNLAELHIARMLYINDWQFRFVVPTGKKGEDYDFEIKYNNNRTCADAKCKIEATELSANTITKTLSSSRNQLPADQPGVFFVKVPQSWIEAKDWQEITIKGVHEFYAQGSGRIVSVALYCEPLLFRNGILAQRHAFYEIVNPRRRFGLDFDWRFFNRWRPTPGNMNALPFKWIRLANFPEGMKGHEKD